MCKTTVDPLRQVSSQCRDRFHGCVVQRKMTMEAHGPHPSDTMPSPVTGETLNRGIRPFVVTYKSQSLVVDLPGYYPTGEGEGVVVGADMKGADEALRTLKEIVEGIPTPETIRRIRTKLKLSQREAGALLREGENAFDKYERGLVEPSGPTSQLMKILDRHPEILDDLR